MSSILHAGWCLGVNDAPDASQDDETGGHRHDYPRQTPRGLELIGNS
ncbi:MAG: hypothetical protein KIT87_06475 [Anaerolineae bacterium]|nr:hypothetical protein [Anaerolineae bacterium]